MGPELPDGHCPPARSHVKRPEKNAADEPSSIAPRSATSSLFVLRVRSPVNRGSGIVLVLLVCCAIAGLAGAGPVGATGGFAQEDIDADDVLLAIDIEDDGDAVWTVEYRNRLETDDEEAAFDDLQTDIEDDPEPYLERFRDRMESTAENAAAATGREMAISGMNVEAERRDLPQEYGIVTYTFRWSNFAAIEGERLRVGDAIDGLFLDEETTLLVSWPAGYDLLGSSPSPSETRDSSVVYAGPTNFATGEPRLELGPPGLAADDGISLSAVAVGALVALLIVGAAGIFAYRRREESPGTATEGEPPTTGEPPSPDADPAIDPELLSNEEQVIRLLERNGGRMKQTEVAERLEWTDAKTSQVTKGLREEGDLEGFRLGRENVLSLPDDDE